MERVFQESELERTKRIAEQIPAIKENLDSLTHLASKLVDLERKLSSEIEARKHHRQLEREVLVKLNKYLDHWLR